MKAAEYLQELASVLGLSYIEGRKPFDKDPLVAVSYQAGSILGARAGHPLALSLVKMGRSTQLAILIRYKEGSGSETPGLETAAKDAFKATKVLSNRSVKAKPGRLLLQWTYSFKKPPKEEVAGMLDAVLAAISAHAQPFSGKCEGCGQNVGGAMVLMNDVPSYICSACQQKVIEERRRDAEAYAARDMQFGKSFLLTTLAAAAGAFAFSWVYFWLDKDGSLPIKVVLLFPVVIGAFAGWVFSKTVGRITLRTQAIPLFLLGAVGAFAALVGYGALYVSRTENVPMTTSLIVETTASWFRFHLHGGGIWMLAGYVVSGIACAGLVKAQEPKFSVEFVPLAEAAMKASV